MMSRVLLPLAMVLFVVISAWAGSLEDEALREAANNLDLVAVKSALKKGANPNAATSDPRPLTPLGAVTIADRGFRRVEDANATALEIVEVLFSNGAKIGIHDWGILFIPIAHGNAKLIGVLLDHGVSPTTKIEGYTPTELALKYGQKEAYDLLVSRGGTPVNKFVAAQLALVEAASSGDVARMEKAVKAGARIDEADADGRTALINVLRHGIYRRQDVEAVQWLLDHGADPNLKGESGFSGLEGIPLHIFVAMNTDTMQNPKVKALAEETFVRLLKAGAKISGMDSQGRTPLHVAAQHDNVRAAEILIGEGARVMAMDATGKTPLDYAESAKLIRLLKSNPENLTTSRPAPQSAVPLTAGPSFLLSDVDSPKPSRVFVKKHAFAIVIGIESYRGELPKADFANRDAEIIGKYLTAVMGYPEENVVVLLNDRATKSDIEKYVESWLPNRVENDSSIFIYFSGHGAPNPKTREAYIVPYDGDPAFADKTGYPLKRLYEYLAKLRAKEVIVVLDSCFSGGGGRSVIAKGMRPMVLSMENSLLANGKTVVLAASSGDQVSSTYDQKGHGLLTYFFLKGLQGDADRDKDGTVELLEIFEYLKPQVERVARHKFNNEQTPQLLGSPEVIKQGVRLIERSNP